MGKYKNKGSIMLTILALLTMSVITLTNHIKATDINVRDGQGKIEYVLATDEDFEGTTNANFRYIGNDEYVEVPHVIKGVNVTSYRNMFRNRGIKGVKSTNKNVTDMSYMFADYLSETLDITELDTSSVTTMSQMFSGISYGRVTNIRSLDITNMDTRNVTNMNGMFSRVGIKSLDFSNFDTSKVTNMGMMFHGTGLDYYDLTSFDTSNVTNMAEMFSAVNTKGIDVSSFDTSNVTTMDNMFSFNMLEEVDISSFTITENTGINRMFDGSYLERVYVKGYKESEILTGSENKPKGLTVLPKTLTFNIEEDPKGWVNGSIKVTVDAKDNMNTVKEIVLPDGKRVSGGRASYTVEENGDYTFTVVENGGGRVEKFVNINRIDKGKPIVSVSKDTEEWTNEPVMVRVTSEDELSGVESVNLINNDIEGVNLWVGGNDFSNMLTYRGSSYTYKPDTVTFEGENHRATRINANGGTSGLKVYMQDKINGSNIPGDTPIVVTSYVKNNSDKDMQVAVNGIGKNYSHVYSDVKAGETKRVEFKGKLNQEGWMQIQYYTKEPSDTLDITVWNEKVEVGTEPTIWTPSPKDIEIYKGGEVRGRNFYISSQNVRGSLQHVGGNINNDVSGGVRLGSNQHYVSNIITIPEGEDTVIINTDGDEYHYLRYGFYKEGDISYDNAGDLYIEGSGGFLSGNTVDNLYINIPDNAKYFIFSGDWRPSTGVRYAGERWKIEFGDTATPWTPSPEDMGIVGGQSVYTLPVLRNGNYTFEVRDMAGNVEQQSIDVTNIDSVPPTVTVKGSPEHLTREDVTLKVNAEDTLSGVKSITLPDGVVVDGSEAEFIAKENKEYIFTVTDNVGNTETVTTKVSNIDRNVPNLSAEVDNIEWTRDPVNILVTSGEYFSGITDITMVNSPMKGRNLSSKINEEVGNIEYGVNVNEGASAFRGFVRTKGYIPVEGNTEYTITVHNDWKVSGSVWQYGSDKEVVSDVNEWVNGVNTLTFKTLPDAKFIRYRFRDTESGHQKIIIHPLEDWRVKVELGKESTPWTPAHEDIVIVDNGKTYPVIANGMYTFEAVYSNGQTSEVSVNVTNIDKTKPTIEIEGNPLDWTEDDEVMLTVNVKDTQSGVREVILPDGKRESKTTISYKVTENGEYTFKAIDKVGNETIHTETVNRLMIPYGFYINDSNGRPVEGAEFALLRNGGVFKTAYSDENGFVDFGKVPPIWSYTVRQVSTPDGGGVIPGDIIVDDPTDPIEVINYPRGKELPSTGTLGLLFNGSIAVFLGITLIVIHKKRQK